MLCRTKFYGTISRRQEVDVRPAEMVGGSNARHGGSQTRQDGQEVGLVPHPRSARWPDRAERTITRREPFPPRPKKGQTSWTPDPTKHRP